MPVTGIDGGAGLGVRQAVGLATARSIARDSAAGGFLNPHEDEGADNDADVRNGPAIIAAFAADTRVVAAVGGFRRRVGDADAVAARSARLPAIVLARWSRNGPTDWAYCLCASPSRLVAFARDAARAHFGPRLLLVLLGDAGALKPIWSPGWGGLRVSTVAANAGAIAAVRREVNAFDAVLVIADERPPTLWRAATFARFFTLAYVRNLGHRDYEPIPGAAAPNNVVAIGAQLPASAQRALFESRFHRAAGYRAGEVEIRAFAAAQVLASAGTSRARIAHALRFGRFATVAGTLTFDPDGFSRPYPHLVVARRAS